MAKTPDIKLNYDSLFQDLEEVGARIGTTVEIMGIVGAATQEFWRARDLHGDQTDRPLGTGPLESYLNDLSHEMPNGRQGALYIRDNEDAAELAKAACQGAGDRATWVHITGEEFFEMIAESDPAKFEVEAVQTIAMLINMIITARKGVA